MSAIILVPLLLYVSIGLAVIICFAWRLRFKVGRPRHAR